MISLIQEYRQYTGLTLNLQKTIVFSHSIKEPTTMCGIKVTNDPVKYLGVYLGIGTKPEILNFKHILVKFKRVASKWKKCHLTLLARVTNLRSLILSVATHVLSTVTINTDRLNTLQKLCNDFLWRGHNRLQEKTVQNIPKWGGLKHIHIKYVMHKICIKWMVCI